MAYAFDLDHLLDHQEEHDDEHPDDADLSLLAPALERALEGAIGGAGDYQRFADMGKHVIRTIHSVPELHDTTGDRVELYLGRAGATPSHVFNRFISHYESKSHDSGVVVARCPTNIVTTWEGGAVRVLKRLKDRGKLCMANVAAHGGGGIPSTEYSVIYLTWRVLDRKQRLLPVLRSDVEIVSRNVADEMRGDVTEDSLLRALDPITRPATERAFLDWAPALKSKRRRR